MPKYGFIAVEGPHDVEFIRGLLRPFGLHRVQYLKDLDSRLRTLVNHDYPAGGDLLRRHSVPLFLSSTTHALAIQQAGGHSGLVRTVKDPWELVEFDTFSGVGLILDSDSEKAPTQR